MASIVSRSNGTYLVRGSCGVDSNGKQIARSKTFKPSKPNLPYSKLNRELEAFVAAFEQEIENEELMPMFARLKMKDLRTYHIQQFVQYLATEKKRLDGREGGIAASTVKRYTTVLRSIVTMAYKLEYIEDDIGQAQYL